MSSSLKASAKYPREYLFQREYRPFERLYRLSLSALPINKLISIKRAGVAGVSNALTTPDLSKYLGLALSDKLVGIESIKIHRCYWLVVRVKNCRVLQHKARVEEHLSQTMEHAR